MTQNREGAGRQRGWAENDREGEPRGAPGQGARVEPGCTASGSDRPAPRRLPLGSPPSPLSPSHFLPPRRLSSPLGPPFPRLQSFSCQTVRFLGFEKKKKKNPNRSEVFSPRSGAQFLPLALAQQHGWFPQLPPGGTWARGRRPSGPALSHDLGVAEGGAHAESDRQTRAPPDWGSRAGLGKEAGGDSPNSLGLTPRDNLQLWSRQPRRLKNLRATL